MSKKVSEEVVEQVELLVDNTPVKSAGNRIVGFAKKLIPSKKTVAIVGSGLAVGAALAVVSEVVSNRKSVAKKVDIVNESE